ncbi:RagB/SusD family nutrient uptake outer membrane protein [Pedobacter antarcticus]|uniref:RagB/SusD family nutrient uptake outer membrane protein n=1 Tax=Pedobacter antarcticus TaxID=34086 RepID=UPI000880BF47|nr:RagB/SusD family nutrient uptake outer membrane protein [Pedobacter antarcticus]SDL42546.1 SusD family protein [Pedobacter antarcticus]
MKRSTHLFKYKFSFRKLMVFGTCLMLLSACKKNELLNPDPTTLITDAAAFSTAPRIQNQVNGLYFTLKKGRFLGSWYTIASDIRAGDFICTNLNAATGATTYQLLNQTTTNDVVQIWEFGFQAINAANVFIDGMNNTGTAVVGAETAAAYIAEARLIRALAYYNLLQLYARPYLDGAGSKPGLPLRLEGNKQPGNYNLARSSVKETYAQILQDLDFAEANLPANYASAVLNTTRAHKNTAIALKTRVFLSMQDYAKVITEANKIISAGAPFTTTSGVKNALEADVKNVFTAPYTSDESIFSMPFSSNDAPGPALAGYYLPGTRDGGTTSSNGAGEYSLNPNGIVADPDWSAADARRSFLKIGPSTKKTWLFKYSQAAPYLDYAPVIRYAEVLLNLSEALTKSTSSVDSRAVALLNAVRNRSDKSKTYTISNFGSATELTKAIIKERQIEFLGEGIRNSDIMRLGLDIPAKPAHSVPAADPSSPNYIFPISNDELILNKLMVNN